MSREAGSKLSFSVSFYPCPLLLAVGRANFNRNLWIKEKNQNNVIRSRSILQKLMYPKSDQMDKHLDSWWSDCRLIIVSRVDKVEWKATLISNQLGTYRALEGRTNCRQGTVLLSNRTTNYIQLNLYQLNAYLQSVRDIPGIRGKDCHYWEGYCYCKWVFTAYLTNKVCIGL